jgi:hypothetical protein
VIVWLWDASGPRAGACGISGDQKAARRAAAECLRSGQADGARVEQAAGELGMRTLTSGYWRTGTGWRARRRRGGRIDWMPLTPPAAR